MNIVDVIIIFLAVIAVYRGYELGLVRQLFSTVGFVAGLLLGSWLQHYTVRFGSTALSQSLISLLTTLGIAFFLLGLGETLGMRLKYHISRFKIQKVDGIFGSLIGVATLLLAVWLSAAIIVTLPASETQGEIRGSAIISHLNRSLPPATSAIAGLGHLISPNGFPQVFTGSEPNLQGNTTVPGISAALQSAIDKDKNSVVKFEGQGCGGIVEGSGFVISSDLVATNAHVVAGVDRPYVRDVNGQHSATVIWFDPELDFAVARVPGLAGTPLTINNSVVDNQTTAAVLGYPGGGPLTAGGAQVIDHFIARGRDIYNQQTTERQVYSLAAKVIPGNSGGPLITPDGSVVGVIFAQSTTYDHVGYALTTSQISNEISQAQAQERAVSTGSCAD